MRRFEDDIESVSDALREDSEKGRTSDSPTLCASHLYLPDLPNEDAQATSPSVLTSNTVAGGCHYLGGRAATVKGHEMSPEISLATNRTRVLVTFCYPCLRAGRTQFGSPHWTHFELLWSNTR
jgi:hypothetical protein